MENKFTKYLIENEWYEKSPLTYVHRKHFDYEIYFDTSNQVELYHQDKRKDQIYLSHESELIEFLNKNLK